MKLLRRDNTGVLVIDVQEKLMEVMGQRERTVDNITKLLHLCRLFDLPVILTEQFPRWLGPTVKEIKGLLPTYDPIDKLHFDCCQVEAFVERLQAEKIKNLVLTGVESHICILQSCLSIMEKGYSVHVPQDAVDSRAAEDWRVGLELMRDAGALITSTETVIYQILGKAGTKEYKQMLKILK